MSSRVFIAGAGVVSSIGIGIDEFERALYAGASGVGPSTVFGEQFANPLACEVHNFNPQNWLGNKGIRVLDRTARS